MKKIIVLAVITLSVCCVAFGQKTKPAKAKKEMIVNDYFLLIPEKYIKADTKIRVGWIDSDDNANGHLEFTIPFAELDVEGDEDANSFGSMQLFKKKKGGVIVALAINMCVEKVCQGQLLFLDYNGGKWDNITEEMAVSVDNEEIIQILNDAPAYEKTLEDGDEVPLAVEFSKFDKIVQFIADCKKTCDGGVVAKMFKWNGEKFAEFEYPEGL